MRKVLCGTFLDDEASRHSSCAPVPSPSPSPSSLRAMTTSAAGDVDVHGAASKDTSELLVVYVVSVPLHASASDVLNFFRNFNPTSARIVDGDSLAHGPAATHPDCKAAIVTFETCIEAKMAAMNCDRRIFTVNVEGHLESRYVECWHGCSTFIRGPCRCDSLELQRVRAARYAAQEARAKAEAQAEAQAAQGAMGKHETA